MNVFVEMKHCVLSESKSLTERFCSFVVEVSSHKMQKIGVQTSSSLKVLCMIAFY